MKKNKVSILFIFPALFFYLMIRIIPMIQGLYYGFTDWDGLNKDYSFIGLDNFITLVQDGETLNAFRVTFTFVVVVVLSVNLIGIIFAVLLNNAGRFSNFFRSSFFLPVVISQVAVAYLWKNLYTYNGAINYLLSHLLPGEIQVGWLTDPKISLMSVCMTEIWRSSGFNIVLILAALQTIPKELYESGDIDGCSPFQSFRFITIPLLIPGLAASVVLSTIGALKQFDLIKVMTDGGPLNSTTTVSLRIIDQAINFNRQGYAASIALVLFLVILVVTAVQNGLLRKKEVEY